MDTNDQSPVTADPSDYLAAAARLETVKKSLRFMRDRAQVARARVDEQSARMAELQQEKETLLLREAPTKQDDARRAEINRDIGALRADLADEHRRLELLQGSNSDRRQRLEAQRESAAAAVRSAHRAFWADELEAAQADLVDAVLPQLLRVDAARRALGIGKRTLPETLQAVAERRAMHVLVADVERLSDLDGVPVAAPYVPDVRPSGSESSRPVEPARAPVIQQHRGDLAELEEQRESQSTETPSWVRDARAAAAADQAASARRLLDAEQAAQRSEV